MYRTARPVNRFEDIANRRVGVLSGTTTEQMVRETLGALSLKAEIVPVRDHLSGIDLLSSDKIDAYFADRAIIASMLYAGDRPGFQVSKQYYSMETYALALPRDDGAFRLVVDRTLARLYRSPAIDTIFARNFANAKPSDVLRALYIINALPE
jgi:polar amino acid transport system substrate-binding protein/glutamate/aspartate transport system substrate-binding protein